MSNHTFIVCAYKEVPYLDKCVKSLLNQTRKSEVIISTSTPNDYIRRVAVDNNVKLVINRGERGHIQDFCFAYEQTNTKYVTLCHQDDIYLPNFAEETVKKMEKAKSPIIAFTNNYDYKNNKIIKYNKLLIVKRLMNWPLSLPILKKSKKVRLFLLSLGNAIVAPTVTYNKQVVTRPVISNLKSNIDWDSWIEFAKYKGTFVYIRKPLLLRRIHEMSTTTSVIADSTKTKEDYEIFRRFWPEKVAKFLLKMYSSSEKNNDI